MKITVIKMMWNREAEYKNNNVPFIYLLGLTSIIRPAVNTKLSNIGAHIPLLNRVRGGLLTSTINTTSTHQASIPFRLPRSYLHSSSKKKKKMNQKHLNGVFQDIVKRARHFQDPFISELKGDEQCVVPIAAQF